MKRENIRKRKKRTTASEERFKCTVPIVFAAAHIQSRFILIWGAKEHS